MTTQFQTAWVYLGLLTAAVLLAGGLLLTGKPDPAMATSATSAPDFSYQHAVRDLDDTIEATAGLAQRDPASWLSPASLAQSYRQRALLTGDYIDFSRARQALERSFAIAGPGSGPFLARAQLNASLHCWNQIESDLVKAENCLPKSFERAAIISLRAERDFQSGRYDEALAGYQKALDLDPQPLRLFALADARNCLGEHTVADDLLDRAEKATPMRDHQSRAWLQMQRAIICEDRGDLEQAQRRLDAASTIMPGWWRIEGRQAELLMRRGDLDHAAVIYQNLVKRTANPEFMDQLARIARQKGHADDQQHWKAMARVIYESEIADFPEAACAHALDHYLDLEQDCQTAVTLGEKNMALRPGGEAACKLSLAYLHVQRVSEARNLIQKVLASRWDMPLVHRAAAEVYRATGEVERAQIHTRLVDSH